VPKKKKKKKKKSQPTKRKTPKPERKKRHPTEKKKKEKKRKEKKKEHAIRPHLVPFSPTTAASIQANMVSGLSRNPPWSSSRHERAHASVSCPFRS